MISLLDIIKKSPFRIMLNTMKYRGYVARIDFDPRDNVFIGQVLGMSEIITFHGAGVDELRADFEFAIDHYLADCEAGGVKPERQAAGKVLLRLRPEQHAAALIAARANGVSLNDWLTRAVDGALSKTN